MSRSATSIRTQLRRLASLPDQDIDAADAALALAALDHPAADPQDYLQRLDALAEEVGDAGSEAGDVHGRVAALRAVIVGRHQFHGDERDYDDLDNADLMRVMDRRRGLPVTLGLVWLHIGRRLGWPMAGLAFPGHFLVRLDGPGGDRAIIDPFHDGREMDAPDLRALLKALAGNELELTPDHYAPVSNREILVRLQNNIKLRLLRCGRVDQALQVVERMLLFAPDHIMLWREAGLMHMRLGDERAAVAALEQFVARSPNTQVRQRAQILLQELRGRLN